MGLVPLPAELYSVPRDAIRNAIIYRNDVVQPVGDPVGLVDESVWFNAREPQAQTFVRTATGSPSLPTTSSPRVLASSTGDNVDTGDGQGDGTATGCAKRTRSPTSLTALARLHAETTTSC